MNSKSSKKALAVCDTQWGRGSVIIFFPYSEQFLYFHFTR